MKLSATQPNLRQGLAIVSRAVGNTVTLPVLGNILFETTQGRLRLSATDLEIGVVTWVGAKVESDGAVTVPARTMVDFVSANTDDTISLSTEQDKMTVSSAAHRAEIPGVSAADYPNIPSVEDGTTIKVPADIFLNGLKAVMVAAALDEARPALAGVALQVVDKQLRLAATDSFRLAEFIIDLPTEVPNWSIIIPARAIAELVRILGILKDVGEVTLVSSPTQIHIKMGDTELVSRLIESTYPDYRKVIPTTFVTELVLNTGQFLNSLRMATIFTSAQANNIHLSVDNDAVLLKSAASQFGQDTSAIDAEVMHHTEEKKIDVVFNARYLTDAVNAAGGSKVVLKLSGALSPAVVVNPDIPPYHHIVMPIRVGQ